MSTAKNMNGISISARLASVGIAIFPAIAALTTNARKITKAGQYVMGVDTTTKTKKRTAIIFKCEGSECTTEWRWI